MTLKERLYRFTASRYGMDSLNRILSIVLFVMLIISAFFPSTILLVVNTILLVIVLFRTLSTNYNARRKENTAFLNFKSHLVARGKVIFYSVRDRKTYSYFICKSCYQQLRVPKGKGTIEITCPKCKTKVTKKT